MLRGTSLDTDFSYSTLADRTAGMSGSDLKELCRNAAMVPVREFLRDADGDREVLAKTQAEVSASHLFPFTGLTAIQDFAYRPLTLHDFQGHDAADAAARNIPALGERAFDPNAYELPSVD